MTMRGRDDLRVFRALAAGPANYTTIKAYTGLAEDDLSSALKRMRDFGEVEAHGDFYRVAGRRP